MNLVLASDEENRPSLVIMIQTEEKEAVIQWKRFSNLNRIVKTEAYKKRALSKNKPDALVISIEEREKANAIIFKLLQQEEFGDELKSLKVEKEIPKGSKILQFSPFLNEKRLIRAKTNWTPMQSIQYYYIVNITRL